MQILKFESSVYNMANLAQFECKISKFELRVEELCS